MVRRAGFFAERTLPIVEHLRLRKNLVFCDVDLTEPIRINVLVLLTRDQESPFCIVFIDQILDFEPDPRLQILMMPQVHDNLEDLVYEFKRYLFVCGRWWDRQVLAFGGFGLWQNWLR